MSRYLFQGLLHQLLSASYSQLSERLGMQLVQRQFSLAGCDPLPEATSSHARLRRKPKKGNRGFP